MKLGTKVANFFGIKTEEQQFAERKERNQALYEVYEKNRQNKANRTYVKAETERQRQIESNERDILILNPREHGFVRREGWDRVTRALYNPEADTYTVETKKGHITIPASAAVTKQEALADRTWFEKQIPWNSSTPTDL